MIDLRSDTVTVPSPAMRSAMAEAQVGDDVYNDDPTVNLLQERCAALLGKEAALFVPTGTMSNAIAIKAHTHPGDEILLDGDAHSMYYELGLPAAIAGVLTRQFRSSGGVPEVESIGNSIHFESLHTPRTSLIVLENTHNRAGGTIIPLQVHSDISDIAKTHGIHVHLDGARLFNAAAASGIPASKYAANADSVTFCLSKGLGCPIGSILCGDQIFINKAKRTRKMLGGGMRQVGIIAAAGLYALDHNIDRLTTDHRHATMLYEGMSGAEGIQLDTSPPPTNMIYFSTLRDADTICAELRQAFGVLAGSTSSNRIRLVTHLNIEEKDIRGTIDAVRRVCGRL